MSFFTRYFSRPAATGIPLKPVYTVNVETERSKPSRTLKHLLKLNHANHATLFNDKKFHNHAPHILGSAYLLGASSEHLEKIYEEESKMLVPWDDPPGEISEHDWRDFLGDRRYERAYVDFFEDQLVNYGYEWKKVADKYLYEGPNPLINGIMGGLAHPMIHLGYAYELTSRDVAMEALTLAATQYNFLHKYLDDASYTRPPNAARKADSPSTLLEIIDAVKRDKRLEGAGREIPALFENFEDVIMEYWNAWALPHPTKQFEESQRTAAALLAATQSKEGQDYDFFLLHLLTSSHAIRIFLPSAPAEHHVGLVRGWWLFTLAVYIVQGRPEIELSSIEKYELKGRDWDWARKQALESKWRYDAHYVKGIRALKEAAATWGDSESFYLKAAVKFIDGFGGWGGFELTSID